MTASFPSNDRAAVVPLKLVDEAALRCPGLDMMQVLRTHSRVHRTTSLCSAGAIDKSIQLEV